MTGARAVPQAIAQTGVAYGEVHVHDRERYEQVRQIAAEMLEESGYETRAVELLALLDRDHHAYEPHAWHIWKAIFLCELDGGEQRTLGSETDEARFFARDAVPEPLRSGAATRALIEQAFEHREHPEWPTDFD